MSTLDDFFPPAVGFTPYDALVGPTGDYTTISDAFVAGARVIKLEDGTHTASTQMLFDHTDSFHLYGSNMDKCKVHVDTNDVFDFETNIPDKNFNGSTVGEWTTETLFTVTDGSTDLTTLLSDADWTLYRRIRDVDKQINYPLESIDSTSFTLKAKAYTTAESEADQESTFFYFQRNLDILLENLELSWGSSVRPFRTDNRVSPMKFKGVKFGDGGSTELSYDLFAIEAEDCIFEILDMSDWYIRGGGYFKDCFFMGDCEFYYANAQLNFDTCEIVGNYDTDELMFYTNCRFRLPTVMAFNRRNFNNCHCLGYDTTSYPDKQFMIDLQTTQSTTFTNGPPAQKKVTDISHGGVDLTTIYGINHQYDDTVFFNANDFTGGTIEINFASANNKPQHSAHFYLSGNEPIAITLTSPGFINGNDSTSYTFDYSANGEFILEWVGSSTNLKIRELVGTFTAIAL